MDNIVALQLILCNNKLDIITVIALKRVCKFIWTDEIAHFCCTTLFDYDDDIVNNWTEKFNQYCLRKFNFSKDNNLCFHWDSTIDFKLSGKILLIDLLYDDNEEISTIFITFEYNNLKLRADADCCSYSWFTTIEGHENTFVDLVGKQLLCIKEAKEKYEFPESNYQDCDMHIIYFFETIQGVQYPFALRNSSNGYYSGSIYLEWEKSVTSYPNIDIKDDINVIIIVGLVAVGKTSFGQQMFAKTHHIIDDSYLDDNVTSNSYIIRKILQLLTDGKSVCIISAKFTDFNYYYNKIIEPLLEFISRDKIITYCFIPDVARSYRNNQNRDDYVKRQKDNDIKNMSQYYDINNNYVNKRLLL
jgi:hypothetical protein